MSLPVLNTDKQAKISIDSAGNLYFDFNEKVYDVSITGNNELLCDLYNIVDQDEREYEQKNTINRGRIIAVNKDNSLKTKIMDMQQEEEDMNLEEDIEENLDEDDGYVQQKIMDQYYPENKDFVYDDSESEDGEYFKFLSCGDELDIVEREHENALYDTLVYDKNKLSYKTELHGCNPVYRICINLTGEIKFRPIGYKDKTYTLTFENDTLKLKEK